SKSFTVKTPVRIDIGGSTLDIWPLNLCFDNLEPITINVAINIFTYATIRETNAKRVRFVSIDKKIARYADSIDLIKAPPSILLHKVLAERMLANCKNGFEIITSSNAPSGGGLAGSSSLMIGLIKAASKFCTSRLTNTQIIEYAKDLEAKILQVPTGLQDYLATMHGGLNGFRFRPGGVESYSLDGKENFVSSRLLLFYSGKTRNSGINNWQVFKKIIDKDRRTISSFKRIIALTEEMLDAIETEHTLNFDMAVKREWKIRRTLFENISTAKIDRAIKLGIKEGAVAARISGAGGGGCFFLLADRKYHISIISRLRSINIQHLPFTVSKTGARVTTNDLRF
ncbi:MAG: hypothetical protein ACN4E2_00960, partial [Nitrospinota bacterium]